MVESPAAQEAPYGIILGVDYGKSKVAISYAICRDDRTPGTFWDIKFGTKYYMCAEVGWHNGDFVFGDDLQAAVENGTIPAEVPIMFAKLGLQQAPGASDLIDRMAVQLRSAGKTLDDLIVEHLRAILDIAREYIADSQYQTNFKPDEMKAMPIKVRLSVPQMWSPHACKRMLVAAEKAGIKTIALAFEPQAALAQIITKFASDNKDLPVRVQKGDAILVADLGCGTDDVVAYRLKEELQINSELEAVRESSGALCGSHRVDTHLLRTFLQSQHLQSISGAEGLCKLLSISYQDLCWQALKQIEITKKTFPTARKYSICVFSHKNEKQDFDYKFTFTEVKAAFDHVLPEVERIVAEVLREEVKSINWVVLVGGFTQNNYLVNHICNVVKAYSAASVIRPSETETEGCLLVCRGALTKRYGLIDSQLLPAKYGYGLLHQEVFDPLDHPDAVKSVTKTIVLRSKTKEVYEPDPTVVKSSPFNSSVLLVEDRVLTIIQKGAVHSAGQVIKDEWTHEFRPPFDKPFLTARLVLLTKNVANHSRGRTAVVENDAVVGFRYTDGVEPWTVIKVSLDKDVLKGMGIQTIKANDVRYYKMDVRVVMECTSDRGIWLGFEIQGRERNGVRPDPVVYWANVWSAQYSEFVAEPETEGRVKGAEEGDESEGEDEGPIVQDVDSEDGMEVDNE